MTRYRQQVKRALRDRDQARLAAPRRTVRIGEQIPVDAVPGEEFDVLRDVDGNGQWLRVARVRAFQGLTGLGVRVIP